MKSFILCQNYNASLPRLGCRLLHDENIRDSASSNFYLRPRVQRTTTRYRRTLVDKGRAFGDTYTTTGFVGQCSVVQRSSTMYVTHTVRHRNGSEAARDPSAGAPSSSIACLSTKYIWARIQAWNSELYLPSHLHWYPRITTRNYEEQLHIVCQSSISSLGQTRTDSWQLWKREAFLQYMPIHI